MTAAVQVVSKSALQVREDDTRQVTMGTQYAPDRPSVAVPCDMAHDNSYMAGSAQACLRHPLQVPALSTNPSIHQST